MAQSHSFSVVLLDLENKAMSLLIGGAVSEASGPKGLLILCWLSDVKVGPPIADYRRRPGGSADGGVWGVAEGEPEFAETLDGAGCGKPIPTFISRCSLEQRGQNALPVSSSRRLASS